jgi:hypothetical protein
MMTSPGGWDEPVTDSSRGELERRLAAADRESDDLGLQMETLRHAVASDVDSTWTSPWKSPETVDAKVRARLAGHREYQAMRVRHRELDELRRSLARQLEKGPTP